MREDFRVSVLFSEPKIPQYDSECISVSHQVSFSALQRAENSSIVGFGNVNQRRRRFSALQRAENSSMRFVLESGLADLMFQCSSASRKFLNELTPETIARLVRRFSALQRAENSSIRSVHAVGDAVIAFQCSSASRKFLNR